MTKTYAELNPSPRVLLGPGPSNPHPRVLRAMSSPVVGHLDPDFLKVMSDTKELLQYVFQTSNDLTFPISGTGSAGMEAALANLIEPGDGILVLVNGFFGGRMCEMVERYGGELIRVDIPWGRIIELDDVERVLKANKVKVVALVHAETSTGVLQPLEGISRLVHGYGALLLVDAVTSLGGCPLKTDEWGLDACYSGSQKCLGCPPGLAPITFGPRAISALKDRRNKVANWYLDLSLVQLYWGPERTYHHTAPISMNYALREALRIVYEEGLEARFKRHQLNQQALLAGLLAMELQPFAQEGHRLWTLTTVRVPEGIDDARVRGRLLTEFMIEIGGGLGPTKGQIWRIGLMGYSSSKNNVLLFLGALEQVLASEGFGLPAGAGVAAANQVYCEARGIAMTAGV
ncbi:MAG: alanine--glyoxylate aminotransferase family protein [Chloroflexi bacterium]|nr:alanine--glyoxylate aminotransferase family protein [Chloroflexota bacterium]MCL5076275.1 alanine--glyoxylate aminotransferase family protein [Chloroflexota bacterium]